jgi:YbbR domain-containing protein
VPVISSDADLGAIATDIEPKTVVITGGETALAHVIAARVSIEGASASKPVTVTVKPVAVDAAFDVVPGVSVAPPIVRVSIVPRKDRGP